MRTMLGTLLVLSTTLAHAATVLVPAGAPIQAAIDAADPGDELVLEAGTYPGDLDFAGKVVTVLGVGPASVLEGTGTGPVVTFASGEGPGSTLDSVLITGGVAERGGGIHVVGASPTIVRNVLLGNQATRQGSGIYIERGSPDVANNLIAYSAHAPNATADPHGVELVDASPMLVNNTIARGDSNGIILRGASAPTIMNNVIALNGASGGGFRRGRGICDFSPGLGTIEHNVFYRNRVAAILGFGRDWRRVRILQRRVSPPRVQGNLDGHPGFQSRRPARQVAEAQVSDFLLVGSARRPRRHRAHDGGNPDPVWNDRDGSRNDAGFTGGPRAPTWLP